MTNPLQTTESQPQNYDISFNATGDPFVDTGEMVLKVIENYFPNKSLLEKIEYVTEVYLDLWKKDLYSIFHTNSKILNPSTPGKHKENALKYFEGVINQQKAEDWIEGYCKTCGKYGILYGNSRNFFPLSGSGAFVNFHHSHEKGSYLCDHCTAKLYFVPFGVMRLGKYIALLHVQSDAARKFLIKAIIRTNLDKIQRRSSEGILASKYNNPRNALFNFASDIISDVQDEDFSDFLQLFHFSNFGAEPTCTIYALPNPVFKFLNKVLLHYKPEWYTFVRRYYRIPGARWDTEANAPVVEKKKEKTVLTDEDCINYNNRIYEKLLSNSSILRQLVSVSRAHYQNEIKQFHIMIAIYFVTEVLNMKEEQIKLIKRIADVVFELSEKEHNYKKYLIWLERAGKAYELRGALLKIIKVHYRSGATEPLIRLEEYVNHLFPDGQYWGEVRDLMLIYLYEKMHDSKINAEEIPDEPIELTEEKPTNQI